MSCKSDTPWTDAELAKLRLLVADDARLSASEIAAKMGRSRNSIIGKVGRTGLHLAHAGEVGGGQYHAPRIPKPRKPRNRSIALWKVPEQQPEPVARVPGVAVPTQQPVARATQPESEPVDAVTFADLHSGMCKYAVSGVQPSEFKFCGAATGDREVAWCKQHRKVVYNRSYIPYRYRSHA